jgi:DNA-directed RNA polymerase subunit alpha
VRAYNCLEAENIQTVRDLVGRTEEEMLKVRNFGKTSLVEIREKLQELGLKLGMPGLAGAAANSDNGKGNG